MGTILIEIVIGFIVGSLMGFTGLGGGVVLLPILILGLHVPPIIAVGSSAAFAAVTKLSAAVSYWRRGHVEWKLVVAMCCGSVPSGLTGVAILATLRAHYGAGINQILSPIIGVVLFLVAGLVMWQNPIQNLGGSPLRDRLPDGITPFWGAVATGLIGGLLVGITSIGAGSIVMVLLLLFFSRCPAVLVGTDICHGVVLTTVVALAHMNLGTVDRSLVLMMLLGSLPGAILGSKLNAVMPGTRTRQVLLFTLIFAGIAMVHP
jgi:uncharacterized membrane protein YfcA